MKGARLDWCIETFKHDPEKIKTYAQVEAFERSLFGLNERAD